MGRIVNVSSTMGSLNDQTDPTSPYYEMIVPAYQASKAALNSITISLAKKLVDTHIKVTSVCPGFVQTELAPGNKEQAPLTPAEAARVIVAATNLPDSAASGSGSDAGATAHAPRPVRPAAPSTSRVSPGCSRARSTSPW